MGIEIEGAFDGRRATFTLSEAEFPAIEAFIRERLNALFPRPPTLGERFMEWWDSVDYLAKS